MKLITTAELAVLLAAAGTSVEKVAAKARANADGVTDEAVLDIEHDQKVIEAVQSRIDRSRLALAGATKTLKILSRLGL